jgi:hypothetical protein
MGVFFYFFLLDKATRISHFTVSGYDSASLISSVSSLAFFG